jgi:hypothetical protein
MSLFKYTGPNGHVILESQTLRFTPVLEFNDPFECLADTRLIETPRWNAEARAIILARFKKGFADHSQHLKPQDATNLFDLHFNKFLPEYKRHFLDKQRRELKDFRLLCLSQLSPDDPAALLMWAHYGRRLQGHDGIVLEFDERHPWIMQNRNRPGRPSACGRVRYGDKRPSYVNGKPTVRILFAKSKQWEYEREYRMVRYVGDPTLDATKVDALVRFPAAMLKSVTLGVDTPPATEAAVRYALNSNRAWRLIPLRRAVLHVDQYRLELKPMS